MKIVKWLVSLFNKFLNKETPKQELNSEFKEFKTDPIVFVKGSPETNVTIDQEESDPEIISSGIIISEVSKPIESLVKDVSDFIVSENINESDGYVVQNLDEVDSFDIEKQEKNQKNKTPKSKKTKGEQVKPLSESNKPTRRGKPKKKS